VNTYAEYDEFSAMVKKEMDRMQEHVGKMPTCLVQILGTGRRPGFVERYLSPVDCVMGYHDVERHEQHPDGLQLALKKMREHRNRFVSRWGQSPRYRGGTRSRNTRYRRRLWESGIGSPKTIESRRKLHVSLRTRSVAHGRHNLTTETSQDWHPHLDGDHHCHIGPCAVVGSTPSSTITAVSWNMAFPLM